MIVLLDHGLDAAGLAGFLGRARELGLDMVPLETRRGRGYEVVGAARGRALELLGTPGVAQILSRRKSLSGGEPLWPHFSLRVAILSLLLLSVLALLAVALPPPLLDPVGTPGADEPSLEWYLRPPAAVVKWSPGVGPVLAFLWWLALLILPFLDRIDASSPAGRVAIWIQRILTLALVVIVVLLMLRGGTP
jgi:quinol-cytochrome oxidoreductase complex cytochrome b subunit